MVDIDIIKDKRKYTRYIAEEGSLAEISSYYVISGPLIDISINGIAFSYVDIGKRLSKRFELNIWVDHKRFIDHIKCETMSDILLDDKPYFDILKIRRRGAQFIDLTNDQRSMIDKFIQNYTIKKSV